MTPAEWYEVEVHNIWSQGNWLPHVISGTFQTAVFETKEAAEVYIRKVGFIVGTRIVRVRADGSREIVDA